MSSSMQKLPTDTKVLLTCHKETDEGQDSLAGSIWHGPSGLVHLGSQHNGGDDLADSHLNTSLDQQELATEPARLRPVCYSGSKSNMHD